MKRIVLLLLAMLSVVAGISASNKDQLRENLRKKLSGVRNPADSLKILTDIYDLTPMLRRGEIGKEVYDVANRIPNRESQLEVLRDMAIVYADNDTAMRLIIKKARRFPVSDAQRETLTFVRVMERQGGIAARQISEFDDKQVARLLKELEDSVPDDSQGINDRILNMFTLVRFLRSNCPGVIMDDMLTNLGKTIESLPLKLSDLRREFFSQSASAYTSMNMPEKAVPHNEQVVNDIRTQTEEMHRNGRPYYNDNYLLYITYRRMIHNFEVLDHSEVQRLYDRIQELAKEDPDIAEDIKHNHRVDIYYYVAMSDWIHAIPLLRDFIDQPENEVFRRSLVKYLYDGAKATKNVPLQLEAADRYITMRDIELERKYNERARELALVASINNANERARALEKEQILSADANRHTWIVVALIIIPLLLLLIVGLFLSYRRALKLRRDLEESYNSLKSERDNVEKIKNEMVEARNHAVVASRQKTDFINNMTHEVRTPLNAIADYSRLIADCVDEDHRPYLNHYVKLIELNNELVETIVNDVLDISEIDNNRMNVSKKPTNVNPMCELAIDNATHYLNPGVTMKFEHPGIDDLTIHTDRRRVEQVLINLLSNAAKFTREGKITLSYSVEGDNLVFAVTDTGSGIPAGKEELIFERFEKLDNSTQGAGLGLPIARLVAGLLKGTVTLDASYTGGARFLFTVPMK